MRARNIGAPADPGDGRRSSLDRVRIVSLLPSATEIVAELGLADELLGITFECRWPAGIETGREVVVTGLDTHGLDPAAIDALVRDTLATTGNLYSLQEERFRACDPELVLTQDLCRVCALPSGHVDEAMTRLGCSAEVLTLDPHTLDDVLGTITAVAVAAGVPERGVAYLAALRARLDAVAGAVAGRIPRSVFVLEWLDPPFLSGHWVPELVLRAGGTPVLARPGTRSVETTWDAIATAGAELIVVSPCGFDLDGAVAQAEQVVGRVPAGTEVWAVDADGYIVRPGPRLVAGIEQLAAVIHGVGPVDPAIMRRVA